LDGSTGARVLGQGAREAEGNALGYVTWQRVQALLVLTAGGTTLELTRSAQQQPMLVARGAAAGQVAFDVVRWNSTDAHHVAATWDGPAGNLIALSEAAAEC
jgi:hypothetical protein